MRKFCEKMPCSRRTNSFKTMMMFCIQVFGSRVRVDAVQKIAELELAEKEKMKDKVQKIVAHGCNVFINR